MQTIIEQKVELLPKHIGVIGLGYVGLPLALLFAQKGFHVIGIDVDENKIQNLNNGISYLGDINNNDLKELILNGQLQVTSDYSVVERLDALIICVPTPLTIDHKPDISFLLSVGESLVHWMKEGQLFVLESSTFPGTTRDLLKPILESNGLKAGKDFYLGYSPERIDPGNKTFQLEQIPKIVSGITENCTKKTYRLYTEVFENITTVSSTEVAEMTKLLENSFRLINISFINEFALNCANLNIDAWEVIDAASTKPFGYTPFYPGPGVGGHCIPIDPIYLLWKLRHSGLDNRFIALSEQVNQSIPDYIVKQLIRNITASVKKDHFNILICGVSYKKDINDYRESPALNIIHLLKNMGINVFYHDTYIDEIIVDGEKISNTPIPPSTLQEMDAVVILTDHSSLPIQTILDHSKFIYDTRNVTKGLSGQARVIRYGVSEY